MGLKTPEINGARQDLPCLESPEVDGARQAIESVKKYVDGAWQEIWCSWRDGYIVDGGKLSNRFSVNATVADTCTSTSEDDPSISSDGTYIQVAFYPTGSRDNSITGYVTYLPSFSVLYHQYVFVKLKTSFTGLNVIYDDELNLNVEPCLVKTAKGSVRKTGVIYTTDDDGYVTYRISTSSVSETLYLEIRPKVNYYQGIPSGWKYYNVDIKEIWCE